jgi:hypothetical protein
VAGSGYCSAIPLAVVTDVAVRKLYVRATLGESIEVAGVRPAKSE